MGIKGLFKTVVRNTSSTYDGKTIAELGAEVSLSELKGQRICIDASTMIYQALLAFRHIKALTDSEGRSTGHITTIFNKVLMFKKAGLKQVWIFDSPTPNAIKKQELAARAKKRAAAKTEKGKFKMTGEHVRDIQTLLKHLGILYIVAPPGVEAEQYGAILTAGEQPYCNYMLSGDSDVLMFGGNLLRPVSKKSSTGKSKKTVYYTFRLEDLLNEMNITRKQLVHLGLVLGSDFAPKTPRIGPASVHAKIIAGKITLTNEQNTAYNYFMGDVTMGKADLVKNKYNKSALLAFLVSRGFNKANTEKKLKGYA